MLMVMICEVINVIGEIVGLVWYELDMEGLMIYLKLIKLIDVLWDVVF